MTLLLPQVCVSAEIIPKVAAGDQSDGGVEVEREGAFEQAVLPGTSAVRESAGEVGQEGELPQDPNQHNIPEPKTTFRHPVDTTYGSLELLKPWFPSVDPKDPRANGWRNWRSAREVVLWTWLGIAFIVLLVNMIAVVVIWAKYPLSPDKVATLYTGDCDVTKRADAKSHLLINVLSTLVLAAANGCLQLTVAPTRFEVDKAHRKQIWLDIGVPSFRNLRYIARQRVLIWCLLVIAAVPLHFLYNSIIFTSIPSNTYTYAVVTEAFLTEPPNGSIYDPASSANNGFHEVAPDATDYSSSALETHNSSFATVVQMYYDVQANLSLYENLTSYNCWLQYQAPFLEPLPSVLLVSNLTTDHSLLHWQALAPLTGDPLSTLSGGGESINFWLWTSVWPYTGPTPTEDAFDYWKSHGNQIQYCLRRVPEATPEAAMQCRLQASPSIMIVICISNAIMCLIIIWNIRQRKTREERQYDELKSRNLGDSKTDKCFSETPLCTLGDAVASFLEVPDPCTKNLGIVSRYDMEHLKNWEDHSVIKWKPSSIRWYCAASNRSWLFAMAISFIFLIIGIIIFALGWQTESEREWATTIQEVWALGFGTPSTKEILNPHLTTEGVPGLFANVIITNIWQVVVSLAYVAHNSILSSMLVADEWSGFATDRKFLRVSSPKGMQRSTYFISMPFRYGMPVMALFSLEHWLLSQTTFIIRVLMYEYVDNVITTTEYTISGYSLAPGIFAITLPILMICAHVLLAFLRKYPSKSAIPLAATCSAAISAACHRPDADDDAHLLPVQWGVVDNTTGIERCSFTTSRYVHPPLLDHEYLGVSQKQAKHYKMRPKWRFWTSLPLLQRRKAHEDPDAETKSTDLKSSIPLLRRRKAETSSIASEGDNI